MKAPVDYILMAFLACNSVATGTGSSGAKPVVGKDPSVSIQIKDFDLKSHITYTRFF